MIFAASAGRRNVAVSVVAVANDQFMISDLEQTAGLIDESAASPSRITSLIRKTDVRSARQADRGITRDVHYAAARSCSAEIIPAAGAALQTRILLPQSSARHD